MDPLEQVNLFHFPINTNPRLMNPIVLAYIGDALHELYIRQYAISLRNFKPNQLHRFTTKYVSAKAQSKTLKLITPNLSDEEIQVVKRGRNAKSGKSPNHTDVLEYRHSTAYECLLGHLYLLKQYERLREILDLSISLEKLAET